MRMEALTGRITMAGNVQRSIIHALISLTAAVVGGAGCQIAPMYTDPPAGSYATAPRQLEINGRSTSVPGATVTPEFFPGSGAQPFLGRFFVEPDHASSARVVVLSHDLWVNSFGSSPGVIGQRIQLDGSSATVVGIAPPDFRFPDGAQLWTPRPS